MIGLGNRKESCQANFETETNTFMHGILIHGRIHNLVLKTFDEPYILN